MKLRLLLPSAAALALVAPSSAQNGVETFAAGNPDGWEIWFNVYNFVRTTGGNPGEYLELDNFTSGPATCQFLDIEPDRATVGTLSHAGDWRAAAIDQVSIDVNIQQGVQGGMLSLLLVSDPGTPLDPNDDCIVRLAQPVPMTPGWSTITFPCDAAQTMAPAGWTLDPGSTGCTGASLDQTWDTIVQDVDEIRFRYDTTGGFCTFTSWIFGIDNIAVGAGALGTNYCTAAANSSGAAAAMSATGSSEVAMNMLTLECTDMPQNSFAFFLTSRDQGFVANPGGSQGNLCLGGSIGRYVGAGQVQNSSSTGEISLAVDLTQHPTPTGLVSVLPGETWNFTCWFRDVVSGTTTSNFADGYSILFQ